MNKGHLRLGFSLIEIVAVMAVSGIAVSLSVGMIWLIMNADQNLNRAYQQVHSIESLAEQFRDDIHASQINEIDVNPNQTSLKLQTVNLQKIEYSIDQNQVIRNQTEPQPHREAYNLPNSVAMTLSKNSDRMVILSITSSNASAGSVWRGLEIQARAQQTIQEPVTQLEVIK